MIATQNPIQSLTDPVMQIDDYKASILAEIMQRVPSLEQQIFNRELNRDTLGCHLIGLYRHSEDLLTRELITEFLHASGYVWLRKLVTRDAAPLKNSLADGQAGQYQVNHKLAV